jgi:hypothetical protein|tara:strand:- start:609 stop:845 length:237 start_codon:yes stop_codon:yes gene_type:complete
VNNEAWRANVAGFADGADKLMETAAAVLQNGEAMEGDKRQPKVTVPPAVYEEIMAARDHIQRVSDWLISPSNTELENG